MEPTAKNWGISIVSRLGGTARPIAEDAYGCWLTQDGNQIVTASQSEPGFRVVNKMTGETKNVPLAGYTWLMGIDCSPRAGLILVVAKDAEIFQIRIFKPDGSEPRTVIEGTDEIFSARWSPTGDSIYYLQRRGSTTELSRILIKSKKTEPVTIAGGLETGRFFTLSADGSRLAYTREHDYSNLWQIDLQSVAKAKLQQVTTGTSYYGEPSFSPDGKWITFALGPNDAETNIFKMRAAGGDLVQLTYFEHAKSVSPAWSPDGQRIAFVSDQNGTPRVWTISANGGTPQQLEKTNASNTNNQLAWWPSSDIVYQKAGVRNYLRINEVTQTENRHNSTRKRRTLASL
jgi:Tol biopolymer transport system component